MFKVYRYIDYNWMKYRFQHYYLWAIFQVVLVQSGWRHHALLWRLDTVNYFQSIVRKQSVRSINSFKTMIHRINIESFCYLIQNLLSKCETRQFTHTSLVAMGRLSGYGDEVFMAVASIVILTNIPARKTLFFPQFMCLRFSFHSWLYILWQWAWSKCFQDDQVPEFLI